MSYKNIIVFPLLALFFAGCVGTFPKTPDLLVQSVKSEEMFSEKDTFEVNRPLAQVSEVLKKKAHECLGQDVSFTAENGTVGNIRSQRTESRQLIPKMVVGKQHTRLTLQSKNTGGSTELGDPPPDGWYIMVVDAYPVGASKTRVESYYRFTMFHGAFTAIKPWVTGTNMGCPDLTQ